MCGRFTLFTDNEAIEREFGIYIPGLEPSYNVAPSQQVLAIAANQNEVKAGFLQWGLVPSWAKDKKIANKMINARAETVDERPAFKRLLSRRRCVIVADSFFEWKRRGGEKIPFRITVNNGAPFTFAGLWDRWKSKDEEIVTCTIITTEPNEMMSDIHDRMPVILHKENRKTWLTYGVEDNASLKRLLIPYDSSKMKAFEVSKEVNNPRNNWKELIERV